MNKFSTQKKYPTANTTEQANHPQLTDKKPTKSAKQHADIKTDQVIPIT